MANFVFLGPPASGKGTVAKKLSQEYGWPPISTGDIFRSAYQQRTGLGLLAHDQYWGKGLLVPDDLTNQLAFERLQQKDCQESFILDGYPRTIGQATALEEFQLKKGKGLDSVLYFSCDQETLIQRATSRRLCRNCGAIYGAETPPREAGFCDLCSSEIYQRDDDREEIVRGRLKEYNRLTAPLADFYRERKLLREINAALPSQEVFWSVKRIIEQHN